MMKRMITLMIVMQVMILASKMTNIMTIIDNDDD